MLHCRLCKDKHMFADTLDAIKFICKDVWAACWDKQIDNLRTNHRVRKKVTFCQHLKRSKYQGVYVLQDNAFKPISRLSSWEARSETTRKARLVRGNYA
jgi:hypothetical protein